MVVGLMVRKACPSSLPAHVQLASANRKIPNAGPIFQQKIALDGPYDETGAGFLKHEIEGSGTTGLQYP